MRSFGVFLLLIPCCFVLAQHEITTEECVDQITGLQSFGDDFYPNGSFPTYRFWTSDEPADDNTGFNTASIAYILKTIGERKSDSKIDNIIEQAIVHFEKYRSRRDKPAYNFWQTVHPDLPFPNSDFLSKSRLRLPDDYDDTAVIQLARGAHHLDDDVRENMVAYAERESRQDIPDFPEKYQKYKAYEVWFADKMDQEYDIVVMCNVLLFVFEKGYDINTTDEQTILLIKKLIEDQRHLSNPNDISPYYRRTPLIIYHLSRMMASAPEGTFDSIAPQIVNDIQTLLKSDGGQMDRVLLYSSLYHLGVEANPQVEAQSLREEVQSFVFFMGFPNNPMKNIIPDMEWVCPAANWTFVLEFLTYYPEQIEWVN